MEDHQREQNDGARTRDEVVTETDSYESDQGKQGAYSLIADISQPDSSLVVQPINIMDKFIESKTPDV